MDMRRVVVVFVGILVLGLAPTLVPAQGLLPGLPALGGAYGGAASCGGRDACGFPGPTFYIGWQFASPTTSFALDAAHLGVAGVTNVSENYSNPGLWLGLTVPVPLSDSFSLLASGWYLVPGTTSGTASESYSPAGIGNRSWAAKTDWWFVDGLLAFTPRNNFALLAGLRYDYFTTKFTIDNQAGFAFGLGSDEADLISYNVIPLIGLQFTFPFAQNNLILRAVGFPALVGSLKHGETLGGAGFRLDSSGNWNGSNGWFFEAFGEFQAKPFGPSSSLGFFMRWNYTHGSSDLDVNLLPGAATDTFGLRFERSALTIGGSFNLNFVTPL